MTNWLNFFVRNVEIFYKFDIEFLGHIESNHQNITTLIRNETNDKICFAHIVTKNIFYTLYKKEPE